MRVVFLGVLALTLSGCAINYYDPATGTQHVWGVGHLKARAQAPDDGMQALAVSVECTGISVGTSQSQGFAVIGWHRMEAVQAVDENATVRLERPTGVGLFNVRVGKSFPLDTEVAENSHTKSGDLQ